MVALASDFVVEVRDVNYSRKGQIDPSFLDLQYTEVFRSVGKWELKLPSEHPLLPILKAKGSGIIISRVGASRPFSGRMQTCVLSQDAEDPVGTWVISGVDDNIVAAATSTYPAPLAAANAQTTDYWTYTGAGETVMKALVGQNIGTSAAFVRKYPWLTTAIDQGRGTTITASTRFEVLGDVLTAIGIRANLGWRFSQVGTGVVFDVFTPQDKTALIRLNIENGGIESTELGYSAPTATQALVLGQGEGAARTVRLVTSTPSNLEATAWGLRWEVVKDERNTDDPTELEQAGQEILTEQGTTINSLKVVPSDAPGQRIGIDWDLGDMVTVVVDGTPATATVAEIARSITSAGVITQVTVGDPVGFDWEAKVSSAIKSQASDISALQTAVGTLVPGSTNTTGVIQEYVNATPPVGWLACDGSAVSRTTYAKLFAMIGTTFGAGDGSTTFNLPDLRAKRTTPWVNLTIANATTGSPIPQARIRDGLVEFTGFVNPTSSTIGASTYITTLSTPYRPAATRSAWLVRGTQPTPAPWAMSIIPGGGVALNGPSGGSGAVDLSGFPPYEPAVLQTSPIYIIKT